MKKFHITITDNETGETIVDQDTKAIIGAFDSDEDSTAGMGFTHCNATELLATATGAKKVANKLMNKSNIPEELRTLAKILAGDTFQADDTDDDTDY